MAYRLDPEFMASLSTFGDPPPTPPRGDWQAFRHLMDEFYQFVSTGKAAPASVQIEDYLLEHDGDSILLRWYQPSWQSKRPSAGVLFIHGGGMLSGSVETYDWIVGSYAEATGVPFLSVDYRRAGERGGDMLVQDCFAALKWFIAHAKQLGVDPGRIAVMGDSAGGCLSAGVAILARDAGIALAQQILLYPALDDRPKDYNPDLLPISVIAPDLLRTMWEVLLGSGHENREVSPTIAPARLADKRGLAPAFIEVGDLDLLAIEDIEYAASLSRAGVPVELHVRTGVGHGFDLISPEAQVSRRALDDRYRIIQSL